MTNNKLKHQLDDLTDRVSKLIGQPCKWIESDLGGAFQIYTTNGGALINEILGCVNYKQLVNQFAVFHLGWNMAKEKYEK